MNPRFLNFIFHFPLCLTFTYIFFVLLSGSIFFYFFYLFLLKNFGFTFFMHAH